LDPSTRRITDSGVLSSCVSIPRNRFCSRRCWRSWAARCSTTVRSASA
jgi:hypothetical protein